MANIGDQPFLSFEKLLDAVQHFVKGRSQLPYLTAVIGNVEAAAQIFGTADSPGRLGDGVNWGKGAARQKSADNGGKNEAKGGADYQIAADLIKGIFDARNRNNNLNRADNDLVGDDRNSVDQEWCAVFTGGIEAIRFTGADGGQGHCIVSHRHWPQIGATFEDHAVEVDDLHTQRATKEVEIRE